MCTLFTIQITLGNYIQPGRHGVEKVEKVMNDNKRIKRNRYKQFGVELFEAQANCDNHALI